MITTQPHTTSYYAASRNDLTEHPVLQGEQTADVCVIGAGFTGISTALHLAERGYKVHVVEANKVGWGASGRNGGQMIGGISGEDKMAQSLGPEGEKILWDMRWAGHQIIRERVNTYHIDCDLKNGYVDVAIKPRHLRAMQDEMDYLEKHNYPFEYTMLSAEQTRDAIGTDAYIGALQNMGNGHLHPLNLCLGEARAAVSLGVTIYEQSPVLTIEPGSKAKVVTADGSVTADFVVLAGNAYHYIEPKMRGLLLPVSSFIMATAPLPDTIVQQINPQDLAVCDPNYILEYFRLSADKRLLFGGRCNYYGSDPEIIKRHLMPRMLKIYPQLAGVPVDYGWGGTIGVTVNRVPQMGRIAPNIFYSQGYSGHGVNVTHLAGQIMAETIAGTFERFDVFANIKPVRLPGQHLFAQQMVALGMMFYKLRDKL
ncbi:NAD(P)/FAD-dependent oxidoreductase [Oceanicoccus sagamiensis]|uniref:FAD-dependent oxidoreductase n=1 Tax=Oceanicoccus sagamiensis TaxID=716816 RepID=A0A1X9NFD7_9GAMM|nr:FAD-binding oxidoreductase [Oceanicoccus sagamiensis]ARN76236.1 FAD-dependent oxidoreductase [Oceanicoccus sagamiensis]